jgi:ketopantoate reductase
MKILMFGQGVISVLYGWALEKAGHTVEFYVRPDRPVQYCLTAASPQYSNHPWSARFLSSVKGG